MMAQERELTTTQTIKKIGELLNQISPSDYPDITDLPKIKTLVAHILGDSQLSEEARLKIAHLALETYFAYLPDPDTLKEVKEVAGELANQAFSKMSAWYYSSTGTVPPKNKAESQKKQEPKKALKLVFAGLVNLAQDCTFRINSIEAISLSRSSSANSIQSASSSSSLSSTSSHRTANFKPYDIECFLEGSYCVLDGWQRQLLIHLVNYAKIDFDTRESMAINIAQVFQELNNKTDNQGYLTFLREFHKVFLKSKDPTAYNAMQYQNTLALREEELVEAQRKKEADEAKRKKQMEEIKRQNEEDERAAKQEAEPVKVFHKSSGGSPKKPRQVVIANNVDGSTDPLSRSPASTSTSPVSSASSSLTNSPTGSTASLPDLALNEEAIKKEKDLEAIQIWLSCARQQVSALDVILNTLETISAKPEKLTDEEFQLEKVKIDVLKKQCSETNEQWQEKISAVEKMQSEIKSDETVILTNDLLALLIELDVSPFQAQLSTLTKERENAVQAKIAQRQKDLAAIDACLANACTQLESLKEVTSDAVALRKIVGSLFFNDGFRTLKNELENIEVSIPELIKNIGALLERAKEIRGEIVSNPDRVMGNGVLVSFTESLDATKKSLDDLAVKFQRSLEEKVKSAEQLRADKQKELDELTKRKAPVLHNESNILKEKLVDPKRKLLLQTVLPTDTKLKDKLTQVIDDANLIADYSTIWHTEISKTEAGRGIQIPLANPSSKNLQMTRKAFTSKFTPATTSENICEWLYDRSMTFKISGISTAALRLKDRRTKMDFFFEGSTIAKEFLEIRSDNPDLSIFDLKEKQKQFIQQPYITPVLDAVNLSSQSLSNPPSPPALSNYLRFIIDDNYTQAQAENTHKKTEDNYKKTIEETSSKVSLWKKIIGELQGWKNPQPSPQENLHRNETSASSQQLSF